MANDKRVLGAGEIGFREVEATDLEAFYRHQLDPEANRMAAFVGKNPADKTAFLARWERILKSPGITTRTIVVDGQVVGHISCYPDGDHKEVTYWIGREFWGQGLASRALREMLDLVADRPIFARAATDNVASIRVLQKCGFQVVGRNTDFANGRGADAEEFILRLDGAQS